MHHKQNTAERSHVTAGDGSLGKVLAHKLEDMGSILEHTQKAGHVGRYLGRDGRTPEAYCAASLAQPTRSNSITDLSQPLGCRTPAQGCLLSFTYVCVHMQICTCIYILPQINLIKFREILINVRLPLICKIKKNTLSH